METEVKPPLNMKDKPVKKLGWGPISAVVVTIGIYFGSQVVGGLLVSLYPLFRNWGKAQTSIWLDQSVYSQFFFVLLVEGVSLYLLYLFLKSRKASPADIGLKRPRWIDIAYALAGFAVYVIVYAATLPLVKYLFHGLNIDQKQQLGFSSNVTGFPLLLTFISLVILPPLVEEILVRGFMYTGLRSKLPKIIAALIASGLFASAHLQFGSGKPLLWVAALDTFILSMVLIFIRDKTDSLAAPIMMHSIKNGIAFVSLYLLHAM